MNEDEKLFVLLCVGLDLDFIGKTMLRLYGVENP
jgi:hypothetical protein